MRAAPAYLRTFCADSPELIGFILGSVSALDPLRGEEDKVNTGESRWFRGVTEADVCRLYTQLIHTTPADLLALVPVLEELVEERAICVTAGKPQLEGCKLEQILSV